MGRPSAVIRVVVRIGVYLGGAFSLIRALLNYYGELDTAKTAFDNRGWVVELIGKLFTSTWLGPALALGCLVTVLVIDHKQAFARFVERLRWHSGKRSGDVEPLRLLFVMNAEPAYTLANELLGRITQQLLNRNHPTASAGNQATGALIERTVRDPAHNAVALLRQRLDERDEPGVETAFADFYREYQGLSTWILKGGELISFQTQSDTQYLGWRSRDAAFLSKLKELSARSGYEALRRTVEGVGWGEGTRPVSNDALEQPNQPVDERRAVVTAPLPPRVLKVRAKELLFRDNRRIRTGEEFTVARESDFSSKHMEAVHWTPVSLQVSIRWRNDNLSSVSVENKTDDYIADVRVIATDLLVQLPSGTWFPAKIRGVELPCSLHGNDAGRIRPTESARFRFLNTSDRQTLHGDVIAGIAGPNNQGDVKRLSLRQRGSYCIRFLVEWDGTYEQAFESRFEWNETSVTVGEMRAVPVSPSVEEEPVPEQVKDSQSEIPAAERRGANRQRIEDVAGRIIDGTADAGELLTVARLPVLLTWRGTRVFRGISDSPKMLPSVKCLLVNAQRWGVDLIVNI
jgi:hypothetical protein